MSGTLSAKSTVSHYRIVRKLGADKKRVSTNGGRYPVWRRDGGELFFVAPDGTMMATAVKTAGSDFGFAAPKPLFKTRMMMWFGNPHEYDVSHDGQRSLIGTLIGDTKFPPPTVILNWTQARFGAYRLTPGISGRGMNPCD